MAHNLQVILDQGKALEKAAGRLRERLLKNSVGMSRRRDRRRTSHATLFRDVIFAENRGRTVGKDMLTV
jgi:hypothetical protein